jgi:hypothetical protein
MDHPLSRVEGSEKTRFKILKGKVEPAFRFDAYNKQLSSYMEEGNLDY